MANATVRTPLVDKSVKDVEAGSSISMWDLRVLLTPYFWPETWALRVRVFVSFSCMALSRGARIVAPLYLKEATNALSMSPLTVLPIFSIAMYCLAMFAFSFAKQCQQYLYMVVKQHAYQNVASKVFEHLHNLSINYHLSKKTGKVMRCLDRGSASTDNIVNVLCFRLLPTIVELIVVSIVFIFSFEEELLSIVCLTGVSFYVVTTALGTRIRLRYKKQSNDHDNKASERAVDSLTNFETVKYFCTEEYELDRYMRSINLFQSTQLATRAMVNVIVTTQQFIQQSSLALSLLICARNVFNGTMTPGDFVAVSAYIANIFKPLDSLGAIYNTIVQSFVDMESLVELLQVQPEILDAPNAKDLSVNSKASSIEFDQVSFHYPSQNPSSGLKKVSFTVPTGHTVAIVGPTGSGKTTTSRLLFRFYDVLEGRILVNGQNILNVKQKSLRKNIGVVPQDTVMFNDSIRYNLTYGSPNCPDEEMVAAVKAANLYDLIQTLPNGFETEIGERGLKLSGGEKQRMAIARLVLKNPSIVVLDEATSSLDTVTERSIHQALDKVCAGRTTLIIAHRLSTVRHADKILVLKNGVIVESGDHDTLVKEEGEYWSLWRQQAQTGEDTPELTA